MIMVSGKVVYSQRIGATVTIESNVVLDVIYEYYRRLKI